MNESDMPVFVLDELDNLEIHYCTVPDFLTLICRINASRRLILVPSGKRYCGGHDLLNSRSRPNFAPPNYIRSRQAQRAPEAIVHPKSSPSAPLVMDRATGDEAGFAN